jgi:hypothetical protein
MPMSTRNWNFIDWTDELHEDCSVSGSAATCFTRLDNIIMALLVRLRWSRNTYCHILDRVDIYSRHRFSRKPFLGVRISVFRNLLSRRTIIYCAHSLPYAVIYLYLNIYIYIMHYTIAAQSKSIHRTCHLCVHTLSRSIVSHIIS